jgi:hypothetical protein
LNPELRALVVDATQQVSFEAAIARAIEVSRLILSSGSSEKAENALSALLSALALTPRASTFRYADAVRLVSRIDEAAA